MIRSTRVLPDLAALLLCCNDAQLGTIGLPLRHLVPKFGRDAVIQSAGHRLSRCPVLVAAFVDTYAATLPDRVYWDTEGDIAARALVSRGVVLPSETSIVALDMDVIRHCGDSGNRSDLEELAVALANLRLPFARRARLVGMDAGSRSMLRMAEDRMMNGGRSGQFDNIWQLVAGNVEKMPVLGEFFQKVREEQVKLGKVNILVAGKTGVGKSTLINAVFGAEVAPTGSGRPVTEEIRWYEPSGLPIRLCDTKGLELADFKKILADLEAEICMGLASGKVEDQVHLLWLCIMEPSERVEQGEAELVGLCERHRIPAIVVLTKAIGPKSFAATVGALLPQAKKVVRVLAEEWGDDLPPKPRFGLDDLILATHDLLPEATKNAFDTAQRIMVDRKRARALEAVGVSAGAAAGAAAIPIPIADAAAVLSVNIGMIVSVSVLMGVQMSIANIQTVAGSMLGAMAVAGGGRLIAGEILKLIPGVGSIVGGLITSAIAASATYGLGYGYVEFLCRFQATEQRMPDGDEIKNGFRKFWESWDAKDMAPPHAGAPTN